MMIYTNKDIDEIIFKKTGKKVNSLTILSILGMQQALNYSDWKQYMSDEHFVKVWDLNSQYILNDVEKSVLMNQIIDIDVDEYQCDFHLLYEDYEKFLYHDDCNFGHLISIFEKYTTQVCSKPIVLRQDFFYFLLENGLIENNFKIKLVFD